MGALWCGPAAPHMHTTRLTATLITDLGTNPSPSKGSSLRGTLQQQLGIDPPRDQKVHDVHAEQRLGSPQPHLLFGPLVTSSFFSNLSQHAPSVP